jgi:hypothetical protein
MKRFQSCLNNNNKIKRRKKEKRGKRKEKGLIIKWFNVSFTNFFAPKKIGFSLYFDMQTIVNGSMNPELVTTNVTRKAYTNIHRRTRNKRLNYNIHA